MSLLVQIIKRQMDEAIAKNDRVNARILESQLVAALTYGEFGTTEVLH